MAKLFLKKRANKGLVTAQLRLLGIVMKQQLPDGSYVIYKQKKGHEKDFNHDSHYDEYVAGEL